jgi:hypothetical protein
LQLIALDREAQWPSWTDQRILTNELIERPRPHPLRKRRWRSLGRYRRWRIVKQ